MRRGLIVAWLVFLLDQLSKFWMLDFLQAQPVPVALLPFFNLVIVWNKGVSFGMLGDAVPGVILALTLAILVIIGFVFLWLRKAALLGEQVALGAVLGGAFGNLLDRLRFGAVFDFLDFHLAGWHWPAFNIADSAICLGFVYLCWIVFFPRRAASS